MDEGLNDANRRLAEALAREIEARSAAEVAESRLRAVIDASPLAIVSLDLAGRVTSWNAAAEQMFGWSQEEVLGKPSPTIEPSGIEESNAVLHEVLGGSAVMGLHRRRIRKDGKSIDLSISTAPFFDAAGRTRGTVILAEDVSLRKREEQERSALLSAEREARAQAEKSAERISRLQSISAALSEAYTPADVADVILTQVVAALDATAGSIYEWNRETGMLDLVAGVGYPIDLLEAFSHFPVSAPLPLAQAVREQRAIWISSREEWAKHFVQPETGPTVSDAGASASIPLVTKGIVFGGLALRFQGYRTLSEQERLFALSLTEQCAQALERAHLYEAEREARARAEIAQHRFEFLAQASTTLSSSLDYATTLASVARLVVPHVADWCSVHMVEPNGDIRLLAIAHVDPDKVALAHEINAHYPAQPDAPSGVPWVVRTGKPELTPYISDELLEASTSDPGLLATLRELGLESVMTVPLVARGTVLGAITFVASESGHHFREADLSLAMDLAGRAATAVDNARLIQEAEQSAREREAILGQIADGIVIADANGTVIFVNAAAQRLLGTDGLGAEPHSYAEAFRGMKPDGTPLGLDEHLLARATLHNETIVNEDVLIRRADGREFIIECSATPVTEQSGATIGGVVSFRDVTTQRSLIRQKDDFLSAAAHDLKTPLTTIKGLAQILRRRAERSDTPETEQLLDGLKRINTTSTRMSGLINELLDVSRVQMGRSLDLVRSNVDLLSLVRRVISEQQHTTELHRVSLTSPSVELFGDFDEARIERALANLLSNAITYSPRGGRVDVSVVEKSSPVPTAVITVTDEGVGIPDADLARVFDRFHRGSNVAGRIPGTGIGLAGAKDIFEQHGGTISVTSQEGKGTTFEVRLPLRVVTSEAE